MDDIVNSIKQILGFNFNNAYECPCNTERNSFDYCATFSVDSGSLTSVNSGYAMVNYNLCTDKPISILIDIDVIDDIAAAEELMSDLYDKLCSDCSEYTWSFTTTVVEDDVSVIIVGIDSCIELQD